MADGPLVDHPLVLQRRWGFKIPDRSGKLPDVVGRFLKEGTLAEDSTQKFRLSTGHGSAKIELLYGEREIVLPDGSKTKQVAVDASNPEAAQKRLRVIIQRERKRNGLSPYPSEDLEHLVAEVVKQEPQILRNPRIISTVELDTFGFVLGLLKIAYELAFLWLGESYLDDPIAAQIRSVLMAPSRERAITAAEAIRGTMSSLYDDLAREFTLWNHDPMAHVAFVRMIENSITISIRIFISVVGIFVVSNNATRYALGPYDPGVIRFIHVGPYCPKKYGHIIHQRERAPLLEW